MILSPLPAPLTSADEVLFYERRDREDTPASLVPTEDGEVWTVDTGDLTGRFWVSVHGTDAAAVEHTLTLRAFVDLPDDPTLVVSPEYVAAKAKITLPLAPDDRDTIEEAIRDAQSDVEAYLGRSITPVEVVERGRFAFLDGWDLEEVEYPIIRVTSAVPENGPDGNPNGYYTITYLAGIDARTDATLQPIRRFVAAHAMNSPDVTTLWRVLTKTQGQIKSVTAEGQSVTFDKATLNGGIVTKPGDGAPGSLPTLGSLDRWRRAGRRVHVAESRTSVYPFRSMG